jgi:hypothetical protein
MPGAEPTNGSFSHSATFVRLREILSTHQGLARKVKEHDRQIATLFTAVEKLLTVPEPKKNPIGYIHPKDWLLGRRQDCFSRRYSITLGAAGPPNAFTDRCSCAASNTCAKAFGEPAISDGKSTGEKGQSKG